MFSRLVRLLPLCLLLLGVGGFPVDQACAASPADDPPPTARIKGSNITYATLPRSAQVNREAVAIIVGNRNYRKNGRGVPDVDYAHNDADVIQAFLVRSLGFREGNIVVLKDASLNEMTAYFGNERVARGKLCNLVREGQSDLFVFYSGHGAPSLNDGQGYLLPVDADPEVVELTGYPLDLFYRNLGKIPSRTTTVVVDACFSGDSSGGTVVRSASSINLKLTDVVPTSKEITLITAAGLAEVASWDHQAKTGLFTRHFLEGVSGKADGDGHGNGDGAVSLDELSQYLSDEVAYAARSLYQRQQHPQVRGTNDIFLAMWNSKLAVERRAEEARLKAEQERREADKRREQERLEEEQRRKETEERIRRELEAQVAEAESKRQRQADAKLRELEELESRLKQQQQDLEAARAAARDEARREAEQRLQEQEAERQRLTTQKLKELETTAARLMEQQRELDIARDKARRESEQRLQQDESEHLLQTARKLKELEASESRLRQQQQELDRARAAAREEARREVEQRLQEQERERQRQADAKLRELEERESRLKQQQRELEKARKRAEAQARDSARQQARPAAPAEVYIPPSF